MNEYCNKRTDSGPAEAACKERQLPDDWPYPLPPGDYNGTQSSSPDFCDHFFFGNYLCPQTCYTRSNDGHANPRHQCHNEDGLLGDGPCQADATATNAATCCNGSGPGDRARRA